MFRTVEAMSKFEQFRRWSLSESLSFYYVNLECCAAEFTQTISCRYDLERFGIKESQSVAEANLLVVSGPLSDEAEVELKKVYDQMSSPKWVMSIGGCNCSGTLFHSKPLEKIFAVDVFVPGCPPRPEAIMYGFLQLQKKIIDRDSA